VSDVCLILEGTYPYVTGGVSTCVYQLIKNTPQINYSIVYIGAGDEQFKEYRYPVPENVKLIKEISLFDYDIKGEVKHLDIELDGGLLASFYRSNKEERVQLFEQIYDAIIQPGKKDFDPFDILQSKQAWDFLTRFYQQRFKEGEGPSFIDYFYTWRFTHYPLFKVLTTDIPRAKVYHALCTGYAGLLGAVANIKYSRPFILTEHGIYSHEREIEIYQADWIYNTEDDLQARRNLSVFKDWWIRLFHFMSEVSYDRAQTITTLFEGNREKQIRLGAPEEKVQIIPNGIDYESYSSLERKTNSDQLVISMVGRVVSIKDVKTFIKSLSLVKKEVKSLIVYIIGPYDEEPEYYDECKNLVSFYELDDVIEFTGKVNVKDYYPITDLLVLSSISEGQPMVILEGFAAGVPCVATDVGACSELIHGRLAEDIAAGSAGLVVPFGKPDELGEAMVSLLKDPERLKNMGEIAKKRASQYYREEKTIEAYEELYQRYFSGL
jgi:glycosyltransferase involved in cell wall biosynthesis